MFSYIYSMLTWLKLTSIILCIFIDSMQTVMSPTKEVQFVIETSAVCENEYSLGAFIANEEFETSFDNSSKL